jgi:hypothetical protein
MIKLLAVSVCCILFSLSASAQSYVSLSTGISKDVSNNAVPYYAIPVMVQWKPFRKHWDVLFFETDYNIPIAGYNTGTAYTLNPSLPASVTVKEKIRPSVFTQFMGATFSWDVDTTKRNSFFINPLVGICNQSFSVKYENYDNKNYEVLNPDVDLERASLVCAIEIGYKFHNDFIVMLHAQSGMLSDKGSYPLSYEFIAPLQLNLGYTFCYIKQTKRRRRYGRY